MSLLKTTISRACCASVLLAKNAGAGLFGIRKTHDLTKPVENVNGSEKEEKTKDISELEAEPVKNDRLTGSSNQNTMSPGNGVFVSAGVYDETFNGVRFEDLPTAYFNCTRNNTKAWFMTVNKKGKRYPIDRSAGTVGYKHCKKSTNAAAQTVGYQIGRLMSKRKMSNIRVEIKGVGNSNKLPVLRGLLMGDVNIVSISDKTYPNFYARPRKPRRV